MSDTSHDDCELVPLIARVKPSLRKRVRQEAANEDLSMQQVVTMALESFFSMPKGAAPRQKRRRRD